MNRRLMALLIAIPVGTIAVAIAWRIVLASALEPMCGEMVLSEQQAPNGRFVFSSFRRNCGATTDYATGLSIRRAGAEFDPSARDEILLVDGDVPVTASWIGSDRIEIKIPKRTETYRNSQEWNGMTISHVAH
jgi:hypothetical protein